MDLWTKNVNDGGQFPVFDRDNGLPGLEKAFREAFRKATVQRCQVHKAKNVLAKIRQKDRKIVADDMRHVFYAADLEQEDREAA